MQERLFELAVEAGTIALAFRPGEGWYLRVAMRRGGQEWSEVDGRTYWGLSTPEMVDVIDAELMRQLGL